MIEIFNQRCYNPTECLLADLSWLSLREDNADFRLTKIGKDLGSVSEEKWLKFIEKGNYDLLWKRSKTVIPKNQSGDEIFLGIKN